MWTISSEGVTPPVITPTGSCATPVRLSSASAFSLVRGVFAGCYAVPAAHGSFPTLSLKVFPWMLDPLPRRYTVCPDVKAPAALRQYLSGRYDLGVSKLGGR